MQPTGDWLADAARQVLARNMPAPAPGLSPAPAQEGEAAQAVGGAAEWLGTEEPEEEDVKEEPTENAGEGAGAPPSGTGGPDAQPDWGEDEHSRAG